MQRLEFRRKIGGYMEKRMIVLVVLMLAGCHQSPEQRCVDLLLKAGKKLENCGISAAPTTDEAKKRCAGISESQRSTWADDMTYVSSGETCDAMRVRMSEVTRRLMKQAEEETKARDEQAFKEAFQKALEESKRSEAK